MEKLAVIFGKSKTGELWDKHFGDSDIFVKYYIYPDRSPEYADEVENKARNVDEHHSSNVKLSEVIKLLGSCDCVSAVAMSPNFKKMAAEKPVQPVVVNAQSIEDVLIALSNSYHLLESLVSKRRSAVFEKEIPVLYP